MYSNGPFKIEPLSVFRSRLVRSGMNRSMGSTVSGRISHFSMNRHEGDNGLFEPKPVPSILLLPPGFQNVTPQ